VSERARVTCALLNAALVAASVQACGPVASFTRPEGDGGWSATRREHELTESAVRAGIDLGGGAVPVEPFAGRPGRLTLRDALARAQIGNRRLAEARTRLAIARQRVFETRGRLLPSTTGTGRYTWYTDAQTVTAVIPGNTGPPPTFDIREKELGTMNGTITMPIDLTGEIRWALAAAQAGYRGEAARLWATQLAQEVVVVDAYYTLLEAARLRDVTTQTIALHEQQLAFARSRFEGGRLTKNEMLVVEVALRNAQQRRMQEDLAVDQARWALNVAIGLPVDAPTQAADVGVEPALPDPAEALRVAYRENPALSALVEEQQRLEAEATSLARGRLPRFAAGAMIDHTTSDIIEPRTIGSGFTGFEWDLGTDTRREARIAEARLAADANRTRVERELRELELAVRATHRAAAERLAARRTALIAVEQAEENFRIRRQQFDAGRATSEDVLDAEALLASQRAVLATALYQAQARRAELQRLMGRPIDDLLDEGD
jgi:outer membrane protein TolC